MKQVLQLTDGETSRSFRGLQKIQNDKGEITDLLLDHHQLYDVMWKLLMCNDIGRAINTDEPGFGKVGIPHRWRVIEPVDRLSFSII